MLVIVLAVAAAILVFAFSRGNDGQASGSTTPSSAGSASPGQVTLQTACAEVAPDMALRVDALRRTAEAVRADIAAMQAQGDTHDAAQATLVAVALERMADAQETQQGVSGATRHLGRRSRRSADGIGGERGQMAGRARAVDRRVAPWAPERPWCSSSRRSSRSRRSSDRLPPRRRRISIVLRRGRASCSIVTDDQRWDTLWAMPHVRDLLADRGTTFSNAFVVNPLCCPSRSSILTGNYSHTTGVYRETPPFGAFPSFHDGSTIATWLHDQGYTTGLFGKYIDAYQHAALTGYVPPGWDRWAAFVRSRYLDYKLTIDGDIRTYGDGPSDYSTNVLGSLAERFIRDTSGPIFVEYAPAAPHAPRDPGSAVPGSLRHPAPWRPPSYDEPDVSDKPSYIRDLPPLSGDVRAAVDGFRQNQYRTLLSVDSQVEALVGALRDTGRLGNTLIVFTSDNGIVGEHRWVKKEVPYEESIRVPLVVRRSADGGRRGGDVVGARPQHRHRPHDRWGGRACRPPPTDGACFRPRRRRIGVADAIPDRAHGRSQPGSDLLCGANGSVPLRSIRDGRTGAVRPAERSVRTDERGGSGRERSDDLQGDLNALCVPAPPGYHPREGAVAAASLAVVALFLGVAVRRRTSPDRHEHRRDAPRMIGRARRCSWRASSCSSSSSR